jgi:hypothetical protein
MADGKLKKVSIAGGPAQTVCESRSLGDGAWTKSGWILFDAAYTDSIRAVPASGGTAIPVTWIDRSKGEMGSAWPQALPDGRHFLYLALTKNSERVVLKVGDLKSRRTRDIFAGPISRIVFVKPGYLIYARDRALLAQRFDPRSMKLIGDGRPITDDVASGGGTASNAEFSASENGVLVFRGGQSADGHNSPGSIARGECSEAWASRINTSSSLCHPTRSGSLTMWRRGPPTSGFDLAGMSRPASPSIPPPTSTRSVTGRLADCLHLGSVGRADDLREGRLGRRPESMLLDAGQFKASDWSRTDDSWQPSGSRPRRGLTFGSFRWTVEKPYPFLQEPFANSIRGSLPTDGG